MKLHLSLFGLLLASVGSVVADVPRKPHVATYNHLVNYSPFTVKKEGPVQIQYNHLDDYVLMGVSPLEKGYSVSILNSKRPNDGRLTIKTGVSNAKGIKIVDVIYDDDSLTKTKVRISDSSGKKAEVGFEPKYLASYKAPAPSAGISAGGRQPTRPGQAKPQQGGSSSNAQRPPRRRVLTPGNRTQGTSSQGSRTSGSSQGSRTSTSTSSRNLQGLLKSRGTTK